MIDQDWTNEPLTWSGNVPYLHVLLLQLLCAEALVLPELFKAPF